MPSTLAAVPAKIAPVTFDTSRLFFDKGLHKYYLEDTELLSVTQALELGLAGTMGEEHWTDEARLRGSYVHEAILFYSQGGFGPGGLKPESLHPIVKPYFDGYLRFLEDAQPELLHVEQPVCDEEAGYAGTFDLLCRLRGGFTAEPIKGLDILDEIDAKSGSVPWWVRLQLAAYRRPIARVYPNTIIRPWALHLRKDGTYRLVPAWNGHVTSSNRRDEQDFLAVLRTAQLKRSQA